MKKYKIVRLCNQTVGSFAAIDQLNEQDFEVRADPESWQVVLEQNKPIRQRIKNRIIGWSFVTLFVCSLIAFVIPPLLLLLLPFGVTMLTFYQGLSLFVASIIGIFISYDLADYVEDTDYVEDN